jgi:hypothetical protein
MGPNVKTEVVYRIYLMKVNLIHPAQLYAHIFVSPCSTACGVST